MTSQSPFARKRQEYPSLPTGEVLGTYNTYPEAQAVVDRLSKAEFPVKKLAIVGNDLKTVERVTGKLTYARAAGTGAASGAWFGLFFGLILFLFSSEQGTLAFVGAAVLIGAGFGMIFGIVSYTLSRQRRDFTSIHQVLASNYQIMIDPTQLVRAQELLSRPVPTAAAPNDAPAP